MKYKVGDIVRQFTDDRKVSWRGIVTNVGPLKSSVCPTTGHIYPFLGSGDYWIEWDNKSSSRVDSARIEFDKEYLREIKLNELGI